jgi:hypothetical protein
MLMMTNLEFKNSNGGGLKNSKGTTVSSGSRDYDAEMSEESGGKHRGGSGAANMDMDDEDDEEDEDDSIDADTEDALNEFAFLTNEKSSSSSSSASTADEPADDWKVDKTQLNELTEQYKKERRSMSGKNRSQHSSSSQQQQSTTQLSISSQRPNRSALQAMIANLAENDSDVSSGGGSNGGGGNSDLRNPLKSDPLSSGRSGVGSGNGAIPSMFLTEDDQFGLDSSLGELSRISVNNPVISTGVNDEVIDVITIFFLLVQFQLQLRLKI